ncbi:MAG: hypothetical protein HOD27_02960 [Betaproteobacteria bacterium]|jgi:hypothetical protein|nr:hypothetical protein [Betaproteobacteria bacterium]MBT6184500.1 hypothetical protein [Betaproteobacteria bacterium]MBT6530838.1 hypothetical protein [Betaproteobacteria bacterium]MBT7427324.1 hypothetical protein [Betaproteobacteria bacterium]MBT7997544.1 hypothetical protein [Betaproteobacteria bacterium]
MILKIRDWFNQNIMGLAREFRLSFLPPLMVYVAAGISPLTQIVGSFYVKEQLGLTAEFLAGLAFWAMLPWALKMPIGHLVDLLWKIKSGFVYLGALMIAASLSIMILLLGHTDAMVAIASAEAWFITSSLLAPIGYVLQDVVADAMTVEAVPSVNRNGSPLEPSVIRSMHTTMQLLGRLAIIVGGILVALLNVTLMSGVAELPEAEKSLAYLSVYQIGLLIPVSSILGVLAGSFIQRKTIRGLVRSGHTEDEAVTMTRVQSERPSVNWWILGGGLAFALLSISIGLADVSGAQEIVFVVSSAIILFLMSKLIKELDPKARQVLIGTAVIIFAYRAVPTTGAGTTWWMIDVLEFDQSFIAKLSVIASFLALFGMIIFRKFMAEKSIAYVIGALTIVGTLLMIPDIAMFYGFHYWTAQMTDGIVDQRFIAVIDTAMESPLGQIAMVPMLAWIANSAPQNLKATFFAVMASFSNLALSAAQLGTKYLNQLYTVAREVKDRETGNIITAANYDELGPLFITVACIAISLPLAAIFLVKSLKLKSA